MRGPALLFKLALAALVICSLVLAAGWLWYNQLASAGEIRWHGNELDNSEEGAVAELRYLSDTFLFGLKTVPASILALWVVVSWMVYGRDSLRPATLKSHISARIDRVPAP